MDSKFSAMDHQKKSTSNSPSSWRKDSQDNRSSKLVSLIDNSLVQFLVGLFLIALLTQAANNFDDLYLKLILKTIGYGIFFYLATPFIIYWLVYVSSVKFTKVKIGITILLVGIYSYVFWDSYFSYRHILGEILFSTGAI